MKNRSIRLISMGCFKNTVDSERMLSSALKTGMIAAEEGDKADVCVINTCGFIKDAIDENIAMILDAVEAKENGEFKMIVVAGCLVNRYGREVLAQNIPEVDAWILAEDSNALLKAIGKTAEPPCGHPERARLVAAPQHIRYLKIAEGCSNRCSYCTIPSIRGGLRSSKIADLVKEAEALAEDGAREIILVAQDLTVYGSDIDERGGLISLIDALEKALPHDMWLRLLYLQPTGVDRRLLERVANGRQLLPYLDIPIQHASDGILRAMNRRITQKELRDIFLTARSIREDLALRTTCMVGFPGETRADFDELLRFIEEIRFDRAGVFAFSPEEGTPAEKMDHQVAKATKARRIEKFMTAQEAVSLERQQLFVGKKMKILIDQSSGVVEGRSYREAPDVDGIIEITPSSDAPEVGSFIEAVVTEAFEHDMIANEV